MRNFNLSPLPAIFKKVSKFFFEFIVVVFGVYLGFMANNYAEDRKQMEYVNTTIKEMYHSLEEDISDAELNKKGHQGGIKAAQYFFNLVRNQSVAYDSFGIYIQALTRNYVSVQNISPFETIRAKGFNVISNDSLRRQMIKLYDFQYEVLEKIEEKYQESQLYANESHHINEILDASLIFNDELKLQKIIIPLNVTEEEKSRLILILKRIYNTRMFNLMVYDDVISDMKQLRTHLAQVYPFVLEK